MAGRIITPQLRDISGVAAGQTAVIKLPIGFTYHGVMIPFSGMTLAQMKEIRLVVNGDVLQRWVGGARLDSVNQFDKQTAAGSILRLDFERRGLLTRQSIEHTVLGTGWNNTAAGKQQPDPRPVTSAQIEIDIDAAAAAPAISYVIARRSAPQPSGDLLRVVRKPYSAGGAGDFIISDLPIYGGIINRIHFVNANISSVKLELDNQTVFERSATENSRIQTDAGRRTPQAGVYTVDFSETGYGGDFLDVRAFQDVRWTINLSAGGTIYCEVESLDVLRKF
ncbi:MAG TPA: major capsid protein P2 [Nitrococcus sp.]|nr:major capsid protein P2 [Nitrococcus sp.]